MLANTEFQIFRFICSLGCGEVIHSFLLVPYEVLWINEFPENRG